MFKHLATHLPYFSAAAKHLSFSLAANELSISQSAVSYQIQKLEDKLGFRLFLRGKGSKIELSAKGEHVYKEYVLLEKNFNRLITDIQFDGKKNELKITSPVDIGVKIITPLIPCFKQRNLRINLDLNDTMVQLKNSMFDFSIRNNENETELEYYPLLSVDNVLICSKDYAERHRLLDFKDISNEQQLIVRERAKSRSWEALFEKHQLSYRDWPNKQVINNSFGIFEAVICHQGLAILPRYFLTENHHEGLYTFPDSVTSTQFYLAFQPSYLARQWANVIQNIVVENNIGITQ